jgi:hypothetical protein
MKKLNKFLFAICLIPLSGNAQIFNWEAPVDSVTKDGYYRIILQPDVTSKLKTDFSDVRIYDQDGNENPYLIYKDDATYGIDRFVTYQIVDKHYERGCCSHITVKNLGDPIDHIMLEVNNADVSKHMELSGSYDGVNFFALRNDFTVGTFNTYQKGARKTTSLIRFDFPLTDYKYYRFNFDDWTWWWDDYSYPVFVVRAGYTEPTYVPEECLEIPRPLIVQIDSAKVKQSFVKISFADSQYVDHLHFSISTKNKHGDYYRAASLYESVDVMKGGVPTTEERFITSTILSSLNDNEFNLGQMRVKNLVLKINNDDNRPLRIDTIRAFQVKHYLCAELEKGNHYTIRFGNDSISAPVYDMVHFKEKIPTKPEIVKSGSRKNISEQRISVVQKAADKKKAEEQAKDTHLGADLFKNKGIIWGALSVVILLLGFMTMRMLKEMKAREEKGDG